MMSDQFLLVGAQLHGDCTFSSLPGMNIMIKYQLNAKLFYALKLGYIQNFNKSLCFDALMQLVTTHEIASP